MEWKTYLVLYFSGKETLSKAVERIEKLGFKSTFGPVDFVYEWKNEPTKEDLFELGDRLSVELKDSGVFFNLDTHN